MPTTYTPEMETRLTMDPQENSQGVKDYFWSNKMRDVLADIENSLTERELDLLFETDNHIESILNKRSPSRNEHVKNTFYPIEYPDMKECILFVENIREYGF